MEDIMMRFLPSGAIRAVLEGEKRILEVLAAPFGSMDNLDRLDQFLSARTDFMIDIGDKRPTLYMHGYSPRSRKMERPTKMGVAIVTKVDNKGLWMRTELDDSELATRTWEAALKGEARASTGSINYLERSNEFTGEVTVWPIAELSVFDGGDNRIPVSDDAVVLPLRAYFDECNIQFPETFEAGEDKDKKRTTTRQQIRTQESLTMADSKELQAAITLALAEQRKADDAAAKAKAEAEAKAVEDALAMRASIIEELSKANPQARALFNVQKETTGTEKMTAEAQETHEYVWNLRKGGTPAQRAGISYEANSDGSFRVLEETEAAEGLPFVPQELDTQVRVMRDEVSLVNKLGLERRKSNRLIYNFIREDAGGFVALAAIAEEGAYVAAEPAFALAPVTVGKYGSMITATEELLEDQVIFQAWLAKAIGRKWALAENLQLFTVLKAGGTEGTHSATITAAEVVAYPFTMTEPWVDGAHLVMASATMGAHRGLLIATPRAFGEFPAFGGREYPSFMGFRAHLNSNWEAIGGGDTTLTMSLINPDAIGWVERSGISIKVDPYGDAANGRVRYFPRVRFNTVITQALGVVHYTDHA